MEEIKVTTEIQGDPKLIWEYLSDHAGLKRFHAGILDSTLDRPGDKEPNGLGAIRKINAGLVQFKEKITYYEEQQRYDYKITECSLPLDHRTGSITMEPIPGGVRVVWTSTLRIPIPLIGPLAGILAKMSGSSAFTRILAGIKTKVESTA